MGPDGRRAPAWEAAIAEARGGPVVAPDGWISLELEDDLRAHLHIAANSAGEIVVNGLYLDGEHITTDTLRRVHPGRIVAAVRGQVPESIEAVTRRTTEGHTRLTDEYLRSSDFAARLVAFSPRGDDGVELGELRARAPGRRIVERPREPLGRPGPDPERLDDFYLRVAEAYSSAAETSGRPAAVLAEENDVPVGTVHRWVREARRRGHLGPGRRGVAG